MTQKDKIIRAGIFAHKMKSIARSIEAEGNDYNMSWHKTYVRQIEEAANSLLEDLTGKKSTSTRKTSKKVTIN